MNKKKSYTEREMSKMIGLPRTTIRSHVRKRKEFISEDEHIRLIKPSFIRYAKNNIKTKNMDGISLTELKLRMLNMKYKTNPLNSMILEVIETLPKRFYKKIGFYRIYSKESITEAKKRIENLKVLSPFDKHKKVKEYIKENKRKQDESELAYAKRVAKANNYSITSIYRIIKNTYKLRKK
ncbi:MAG: hypothetical protein LBD41_05575 [Clostridiales Family XIII bacterium]|jgi:hypothetical protein|nr:hypothetical protein [Clostridiales Family XIII bacterium]